MNPLIPPVVPVGLGPAQTPALGATDGSGSSNPSDGTDAPRRGMLRADWTRKHRERRPAVALAFLPHEEVEGDPNAWVSLTRRIDALRDAAAGAGCALALVVVGDDAPERLPPRTGSPRSPVRPGSTGPPWCPCPSRQPRTR